MSDLAPLLLLIQLYTSFLVTDLACIPRTEARNTINSPSKASRKVKIAEGIDQAMAEILPPSPTSSDAVTASEGGEDVRQDNPDSETRKDTTTDLIEIVASHPKLGPALSDFLEKIAPWKGIMPGNLVQDMERLEDFAVQMRQKKQPDKTRLVRFTNEVLRLTMEDWHTNAPFVARDPIPIIQTYSDSDNLDSESTGQPSPSILLGDIPKSQLHEDSSLLQRVQINSFYLRNELSTITGISIQFVPIFMASPFKLLLEYIPQIEHRWALLRDQLQNMQAKPEQSEIGSTADTSCEHQTLKIQGNEQTTETSDHSNKREEDKRKRDFELFTLSERVSQLKCLLDFIQTEPDLQRILGLRAQIEAGSLETIRFPDIWLLFRPGDLVVSRVSDHWQLRKVYSTTGGQIQRKARGKAGDDDYTGIRGPGKDAWTGTATTVEEDETEKFLREANFGIGSWTPLKVDCYTLGIIGDELKPIDGLCKIKHFLGEVRITDLPIYPVRFHPDPAGFLKRMEERGLKFLMSPGHKSYKGPSARLEPDDSVREIDGDVYVELDARDVDESGLIMSRAEVTESEERTRNNLNVRLLTGNEVDTQRSEEFMAENRFKLDVTTVEEAKRSTDSLRLLPWAVYAYIFRLRHWENLDIDLLQEIDRRPEARDLSFNELVIPEKTRTLLVSLVDDHASKAESRDMKETTDVQSCLRPQVDLVRGKGQGLIILLHGPPGSGKTSTAETIAAYTQRPLYSITCGDLGLTAGQVEKNLSTHTGRAERWGCVLLLDEADVFLMQRNWHDMDRNALVSVFLRELEYYSGILFLTTNRPGVIDEAFLSRIHMAFRYSAIDLASTRMMWNNIMDRIERDNRSSSTEVTVNFRRDQLLRFAEKDFRSRARTGKPWNGRQIRNAFNTAIGLGRYQRLQALSKKGISPKEAAASGDKQLMEIKLTKTNFQDIAAAARSFEDYIQDLRGVDSEIARLTRVRDDDWGSEGPVAVKDYSNIRKTTMMESGSPSQSSAAKVGLGMRRADQLSIRSHQDTPARLERLTPESDHSDGSEDSSSDDD